MNGAPSIASFLLAMAVGVGSVGVVGLAIFGYLRDLRAWWAKSHPDQFVTTPILWVGRFTRFDRSVRSDVEGRSWVLTADRSAATNAEERFRPLSGRRAAWL